MADPAQPPRPPRHRRRRAAVGASPGTLPAADPKAGAPQLRAVLYSPTAIVERQPATLREVDELRKQGGVLWLDVAGLGDTALLQQLGDSFGLHRLALEDIVTSQQRAKTEGYDHHDLLVLRMLDTLSDGDTEQLSLCLADDFVLTFQERPGDCFDPVRARLRDPAGRMRKLGSDYLAYALLDAVVDAYFPALEALGDRLEACEERILAGETAAPVAGALHDVRRDLLRARRALWPLREVTAALVRGESPRFQADTRIYQRDVHDHVVQLLDLLENQRELGASLMDLHLASASNRLNEVMKVLTVIATIFIPLTFVVGIYGMNFDVMPELRWRYGYPAIMAVMLGIAAAMLVWFRRRGWV